jgi:hypothetical protein
MHSFFFSSENTSWCSSGCGRRGGDCGGARARGTDRNAKFSESADVVPDHPLLLALVQYGHPFVIVGLAGLESLIDENQ